MEIVFLIVSLIITFLMIYGIGRTMYSHKQLLIKYKTDEILVTFNLFFGIMLVCVIFVTLCAINNSIWLLPYLTK